MSQSVTCSCGKRLTVGASTARKAVVCPQCGETVPLNGAAESGSSLTFAVRKVADTDFPLPEPDAKTLLFRCPGCDKEFRESPRAAGRRTKCPQCATVFVIPDDAASPVPPPVSSSIPPSIPAISDRATEPEPPSARPADDAVEAAVAAYTSGKQPASTGKRRLINTKTIVPIGFLLILFGGVGAIVGTIFASKGMMQGLSASGLGGANGGAGGLLDQAQAYPKLLRDLANNPMGRPGEPDPLKNFPKIDPKQIEERQIAEQQPPSSGQGMIIGGIVAGGIGSLLTFIGGIFLLAGLIGRFIEKPAT